MDFGEGHRSQKRRLNGGQLSLTLKADADKIGSSSSSSRG